jgi:hypothetical protein
MRDSGNAKDSEEAIEKVLAGLRDVEAPAGMERWILEGLEGRVSVVEARSGWRRLVPAWVAMPSKALVCGVAFAGSVALILAIPALRWIGHAPLQTTRGGVTGAPREAAPAVAARETEASSSGARVRLGTTTTKMPDAGLVRIADSRETGFGEESVAMSEMQAASFPAPPMPLTAQERLLLRLANKVDPVEMAMLDPKFRAMQDAEEKAEFQRFFGQTPVKLVDSAQAAGGESTADQAVQPSTTDQGVTIQAPDETALPKDKAVPAIQNQPMQKQTAPEQSSPDQTYPDQSSKQQPTAGPIRTAEKERR